MAEAVQVAVPAGGVPPLPQGATNVSERIPDQSQQTPGYVPPTNSPADQFVLPQTQAQKEAAAKAAGISPEDLAAFEQFKAFQASQKAAPAATPAAATPAVVVSPVAALDVAVAASKQDPVLGSMLAVFDSAVSGGVDRNRALGNALTHGDASLIDVAYLTEKGGANAANLVQIAKGIVAHCNTMAEVAVKSIHTIAGGEANWGAATAAFNKGAPQHLKQYVATALNSGDKTQIDAAATSVVEWARASGMVATPSTGFVQTGGGAPGSAQGLSKADFQKAHAALDKTDRNYESLKGELYGRRAIGRQLGL